MSTYDQQVLARTPALYLPLNNPVSQDDDSGIVYASAGSNLMHPLMPNGDSAVYLPVNAPDPEDSSGNHLPVSYVSDGTPFATTPMPNGDLATVFDGATQYAEVLSFPQASIAYTGQFTVEAWIRPDVLEFPHDEGSGYVHWAGKGTGSGVTGKQEWVLRIYSFTNIEVPPRPNRISDYAFNLIGGLGTGAFFQDVVTPGEWIMVTAVYDTTASDTFPLGTVSIYKNGALAGGPVTLTQHETIPVASDAPFRVGTRDLNSFFLGAIGKVAIYNYVASDEDIAGAYTAMTGS